MRKRIVTVITLYAIIMHAAFAVILESDGPGDGATYSGSMAANPGSFQRSYPVDGTRTDHFKEINQATQDPGLNSDPIDGASNTEFDVSDYNTTVNVSTGSKLNVRKGPGTTHAIIGARYRGDKLRVTHHDGQWRRIDWSAGQIAYVHGNYLQNVDSDTESDSTDDPRLKVGNPELTVEPSSVPFDSNASISALSDSELRQRIDNWQGTDNDPIFDRLVSERNARLDMPAPTFGKPSCETPRQCDGSESDPQSGVEESETVRCTHQVFDYCLDQVITGGEPVDMGTTTLAPATNLGGARVRSIASMIDQVQIGDPDSETASGSEWDIAHSLFDRAIANGTVIPNPNGGYMLASCASQDWCDVYWHDPISEVLLGVPSTLLEDLAAYEISGFALAKLAAGPIIVDPAAKSGVKFGQANVKSTFAHGPFAGRSIGDVASGLRSGKISPNDLPVEFVVRNGERVALNNRSLTALRRAGIQPTNLINRTGSARHEKLLNQHLGDGSPSDFIRIRGGPSGTSNIQ